MRRLKWIHPAIIPHIPTNKPSSAEVNTGTPLKLSCPQMQRKLWNFLTVLHRFGKCLGETFLGVCVVSFIFILENVYFYGGMRQDTRWKHVTGC